MISLLIQFQAISIRGISWTSCRPGHQMHSLSTNRFFFLKFKKAYYLMYKVFRKGTKSYGSICMFLWSYQCCLVNIPCSLLMKNFSYCVGIFSRQNNCDEEKKRKKKKRVFHMAAHVLPSRKCPPVKSGIVQKLPASCSPFLQATDHKQSNFTMATCVISVTSPAPTVRDSWHSICLSWHLGVQSSYCFTAYSVFQQLLAVSLYTQAYCTTYINPHLFEIN